MSTEQNKAVVRRFYEAFGANDRAALKAVLSPDLASHSHGSPDPQNREEHLETIGGWNAAFDTHFTVEEQVAEGGKVATRVTMYAVHSRGEFQGLPPGGKEVVAPGVSFEEIRGGKIVSRRVVSDWGAIMQQLGLAPSPAAES